MKVLNFIFLFLALVVAACGEKQGGDERDVIVVSIEPQRYLLEQIVGEDFRIVVLMPNGDNPETFEPSMAKRMDVDNCAAYFTIGYLPFEDKLAKTSENVASIIKTTEGIEPVYGTHTHHHGHAHSHNHLDVDPHMWTSVRNARRMSRIMTDKLKELNPEKVSEYQARFESFDAKLDSMDNSYAARLSSVKHPFMVWHPSLSYFARDYGLEQISVSQDNKENSMQELRGVIDEAKADSVKVFFFQRDYDTRQAEAICESIGARLVEVNPGSYEWEKELNIVVDELCKP